jgi:hypothetical protein
MKQTFNLSASTYLQGYNPLLQINYNEGFPNAPFMSLPAQTADNYSNRAKVEQGKNVVVIHFNPDHLVPETNFNNNVTILPLNVTITGTSNSLYGTAIVDQSALTENQTVPPVIETAQRTRVNGKTKVFLDWSCPYHGHGNDPIYVPHTFTVRRNGGIVYSGFDASQFLDDGIRGNPQSLTYTITTTTFLGESTPITVTVNR